MLKKKKRKYCPKCGKELKQEDKYCISCGYSFGKRKKSINWRNVIIAIIIIIAAYLLMRILSGNPIVPQSIWDIFSNNATG